MESWEHKTIKLAYGLGAITVALWGILSIFTHNTELIYDRLFTALFFFLAFLNYKKLHLRLPVVLFTIFAFTLHHLKLYGQTYFGWLQFDMIMHFVAAAAIATVAYSWLGEEKGWNKAKIAIIAALIAMGVAAINEVIEYFGYAILGSGEGLLFYGAGDFGEYADTAWDLFFNMVGAMSGVIIMTLVLRIKRRNVQKDDEAHKKRKQRLKLLD